ncbi:MAG: LapA family protein [Streptosporangiaceae bacterium]
MAQFSSELALILASFITGGIIAGWLVMVIAATAAGRRDDYVQREIRRLQDESRHQHGQAAGLADAVHRAPQRADGREPLWR